MKSWQVNWWGDGWNATVSAPDGSTIERKFFPADAGYRAREVVLKDAKRWLREHHGIDTSVMFAKEAS